MLYLKLCFLRLCCPSVFWHGQLQLQKFQDVHWVSHSWGYYIWLCATNTFLSSCLLRSEVMTEFLLKILLSSPCKPQGLFLIGSSVCSKMTSGVESGAGPVGFLDEAFTVGAFTIAGTTFRRRLWETCQIVHTWLKTMDSQGRILPTQSGWRWFHKS